MKGLIKIFHFLGSFYFAIFLIAVAAFSVLIGTVVESHYDSHLLADKWIYNSSFFTVILIFFFINILFSALRRWPFKARHFPFLTTHLGLLMIIAGCMLKQRYGIQGNLLVTEGSGSNQLLIPHSLALQIQKKGEKEKFFFPVELDRPQCCEHTPWPNFKFYVRNIFPHARETKETWTKGSQVPIVGLPILSIQKFDLKREIEFIPIHIPIFSSEVFHAAAVEAKNIQDVLEAVYLKDLQINISHQNKKIASMGMLKAILSPQNIEGGTTKISLEIPYSNNGFVAPSLKMDWKKESRQEVNRVYLEGVKALYTYKEPNEGPSLFKIDLKRNKPILLFVKEGEIDHVFAFDTFGRVHGETFDGSKLKSMWVYEEGFGGYSIQAALPFPSFGREKKEKFQLENLKSTFREALKINSVLAAPLQMMRVACDKIEADVADVFSQFLSHWNEAGSILIPAGTTLSPSLRKALEHLEWDPATLRSCQWMSLLFEKLERSYLNGEDLLKELELNQWPFISNLIERKKKEEEIHLFTALAQQMYEFGYHLPEIPVNKLFDQARLLSAYFKAFGIDYSILQTGLDVGSEDFQKYQESYRPVQIETPLTFQHTILKSLSKLEENTPCLIADFFDGNKKEKKSFVYDRLGTGLMHSILEGSYLIRFQEIKRTIPYHIRLHQARQINYAGLSQPYSFECDLTIYEKDGKRSKVEKTLSMNHVYETWDGYRFYLSGMTSLTSGLKRIQLVVNYDPAKYLLTYPGGLLTILGIILLLTLRKRGKTKE